MVYEYAVDPESFSDVSHFFALWTKVGPEHGRLIATIPKKWNLRVYQHLESKNLKPIQLKNLEVELMQLDSHNRKTCSLPIRNSYHDQPDWLARVVNLHCEVPFKGIIVREGAPDCPCRVTLDSVEVDDRNNSHWHIGRTITSTGTRRPDELEEHLSSLLRLSKTLKFIDPFLNLEETEFRTTVTAITNRFLRETKEVAGRTVEIHSAVISKGNPQRRPTREALKRGFGWFHSNLRADCGPCEILYQFWDEVGSNNRFQDRFVATDVTCIQVLHDLRSSLDGSGSWTLVNIGSKPRVEGLFEHEAGLMNWVAGWRFAGSSIEEMVSPISAVR